jgi:hypothetical protein
MDKGQGTMDTLQWTMDIRQWKLDKGRQRKMNKGHWTKDN